MSMNYYMNIIVNSLIIKKNKMFVHFIFLYYFELFNILNKKSGALRLLQGVDISIKIDGTTPVKSTFFKTHSLKKYNSTHQNLLKLMGG